MPYKKTGTDIQALIEPATGGRTAQSLAGYKINGTMLSAATVTSGYLYSNEKYTPTGYKKAGAQLVFQNIGCRPRSGTVIWESSGKTGTILFSREFFGKSYVIVQLWGAGGGSTNGYTLNNDRAGGGSGASAVVCLRLPVSGTMSIFIGTGGGVSGGIGAGSAGTASTITCGNFSLICNGGGGGTRGTGGAAGTSTTNSGSDGAVILRQNGYAASTGTGSIGSARSVSYTDYCPEGGAIVQAGYGAGGAAPSYGSGNGGVGAVGWARILY